MARAHESWVVHAFAGLKAAEISTLHRLLGKVKQHTLPASKEKL